MNLSEPWKSFSKFVTQFKIADSTPIVLFKCEIYLMISFILLPLTKASNICNRLTIESEIINYANHIIKWKTK